MSRPLKHPKTGVYYFREKVPADLRSTFGKVEVWRSLGTKDPVDVKSRHSEEKRKQAFVWQTLRAKPEPLRHKTGRALAGEESCRLNRTIEEEEVVEPEIWQEDLSPWERASATSAAMVRWYDNEADCLLPETSLATEDYSLARLIEEIHRVRERWAKFQHRQARGDIRPGPEAGRFADRPSYGITTSPSDKPTLTGIFALWEREHFANGKTKKTAADFRHKIDSLREFVGHDDAERVTPEDVVAWCDRRRFTDGLSARTLSNKYLVAVKTVFGLACQREALRTNPTKEYTIKVPKAQKLRPKGFTDDEAAAILTAALAAPATEIRRPPHTKLALWWLPWIAVYTGARVGELAQMRREDLVTEHGVLALRITPEAGAVKSGNYRLVPLHPHLIEQGLPEFIRSRPEGPLFFRLGDTVSTV
jgi:hypothetical protein